MHLELALYDQLGIAEIFFYLESKTRGPILGKSVNC